MNLKGKTIIINKSAKDIYNFLLELNNYKKLMPENIKTFKVEGESFIFGLKGMPEIRLVKKSSNEYNNVTLGAASSKLPFTLSTNIKEISEHKCEVELLFKSEFNAMMSMMVKSPLTKFIDTLTNNISKL